MANDNDNALKLWDTPGTPGRMNAWPDNWISSEQEIRRQQAEIDRSRNNLNTAGPLTIEEEKP